MHKTPPPNSRGTANRQNDKTPMPNQFNDSTVNDQNSFFQDQPRAQNPFVEDNSKVRQTKRRSQLAKDQSQVELKPQKPSIRLSFSPLENSDKKEENRSI